jgi:hypothetical protein
VHGHGDEAETQRENGAKHGATVIRRPREGQPWALVEWRDEEAVSKFTWTASNTRLFTRPDVVVPLMRTFLDPVL